MTSSRMSSGNKPNWLKHNTISRPKSSPIPEWLNEVGQVVSTSGNDVDPLSGFTCETCGSPIDLEYFIYRKGYIYHPSCYTSYNKLRCDICGDIIIGQYFIDLWGNTVCAYHKDDMPKCSICERYICKAITRGGTSYQDGRHVCNLCRSEAVDTVPQADASMKYVRDVLGKRGLLIDESLFPLRLIDVNEIYRLQNRKSVNGQALGLFQGIHFGADKRRIEALNILWGMPKYMFESTLAHELGHAWLFLNHIDNLSKQTEEGLCNLLKYIVHSDTSTLESLHEIQGLFRNTNSDYGDGFRIATSFLKQFSLGALIRYVAKHKNLPPKSLCTLGL